MPVPSKVPTAPPARTRERRVLVLTNTGRSRDCHVRFRDKATIISLNRNSVTTVEWL
jgi:hypothetical protein